MGRRGQTLGTVAVLLGLGLGAWLGASPAFACDIDTPDGYRLDHYRAPTPCELPGARIVDAKNEELMRIGLKISDAKTSALLETGHPRRAIDKEQIFREVGA